jgi:hypothetical protein
MTNRTIYGISILVCGVVLCLGVAVIARLRAQKATNVCIMNLVALESAKERLASEQHKPTGYHVTMKELEPYLHRTCICPEGGTYVVGALGTPPTCSIGGPGHALPKNYSK